MSFSLNISAKEKMTGRFKSRVNRALLNAVTQARKERKLTQSEIAALMEIDKSTLSRILNGRGNLTLKTIGDLSWALGLRPDITFTKVEEPAGAGANSPAITSAPHNNNITTPISRSTLSNRVTLHSAPNTASTISGAPRNERVRVAN
ncbi:helix-turn-helix domain-containing protein [Rhodobacteraceae bacterium 2CG4]|uniref:Helix-turn-helix domain-containing protein n=1 Tax=Halovulum marinum TaxID=2662447 RepID=A0A6L5YZG6_9RHOB|nr:helix-turn-helix transcriptional regulator [Halovulum marinum]MSU89262.1 helix-turn-helix domain-containing protein [Halovulum marinum]